MAIREDAIVQSAARFGRRASLVCLRNATVTSQPKSLGHIGRRCVTHQPKPFRDASTELAHKGGAGGRIRTDGQLFTKQLLYH